MSVLKFYKNNNYIDENYFNTLEKVRNFSEYKDNEKKIETISKVLIEHADVPEELIDTLIEAVQENVAMEYEETIKKQ